MNLMAAVLSGFALAAVVPGLYRIAPRAAGPLLAVLPLSLAVFFGSYLDSIASGSVIRVRYRWVPALGVDLSFLMDGLGLLFALLITVIGALVLIYAGGYLGAHPKLGRLYGLLLVFMASMLGLVLADNLLALFVFWELTSLSSYFLIGFDHERPAARAAALQALLVTGGGGLALLAGLLLLGQAGGTMELSSLLTRPEGLQDHPLYLPILSLVLIGAFTKSAQFPFHFWLPGAMEAPTPISAYLHSATMVKAGIYLLARLSPILAGTEAWLWTVSSVGAVTMLIGSWLALQQFDLKRILAYSTVSSLGALTLLLGLGGSPAVPAAMTFLLAHALYKGALFLVAGVLDHEIGTRDVRLLGGLFRKMPMTAIAAVIAALSMAGLPPLLGFIGKEFFYEAALGEPAAAWITGSAVVANMFLVAVAVAVGIRPFVGRFAATPRPAHEAPISLWLGPLSLSVLSVVFGIWPGLVVEPIVFAASASVLGRPTELHLALWHGPSLVFALGVITILGGAGLYAARGLLPATAVLERFGPGRWYLLTLAGLNRLSEGQTRLLQSGYLRYYLSIILATTVGFAGFALFRRGARVEFGNWSDLRLYEAGVVVLILLATIAAVIVRSRLAAIAALGAAGYGIALVFVFFGAPDVAMTQFLIETLTVILFVLVFYHLREDRPISRPWVRGRDVVLSLCVGTLMTAFVLVAVTRRDHDTVSTYFNEHSVPAAHGRNIVNVILVDFRGLDTLGEITVLTTAAIGVYALIKLRPRSNNGTVAVAETGEAPTNGSADHDRHAQAQRVLEQDQQVSL